MKKVTILALHLGYGGIERTLSMLSNALCNDYKVEIVSTYKLYDKPFFELDDRIKVKYLISGGPHKKEFKEALKHFKLKELFHELKYNINILKLKKSKMINYIKKCNSDVIISTRDIHNKWLGQYGKRKALKIGWEHNYHNNDPKYIKKILSSVSKLDKFVLVSKELYNFYKDKVTCECVYIPNSLDFYPAYLSKLEEKNIIAVGRISPEKGFLDMIDVFDIVRKRYPDWKLNIVGDGNELDKLKDKIKEKHLDNKVIIHGYQNREYINDLLSHSSIFLSTSYTESFGIVVLEAFAYGIPCVAFDSAHGICEIVSNNWSGYLISDRNKEEMAKRIISLIKDQNRRLVMGMNGYKKSCEYNIKNVAHDWIDIIENKNND